MAIKKRKSTVRKLRPVAVDCPFCKEKKDPDYKDYEVLSKYLTERGKILPKTRTGLCTKHQRKIASEIKRARHLGLLPFTAGL